MTELETKLELEVGKEYRLGVIRPRGVEIKGKYLGNPKGKDVFVTNKDGEKGYVFMVSSHVIELNGLIAYTPLSSFIAEIFDKKRINKSPEKSLLLEILKELGEDI